MEKHPDAISGQGGHGTTYSLVCSLFWGFGGANGLTEAQAWQLLEDYNNRLGEKWTRRDLEHKVRSAMRGPHRQGMGHLIDGTGSNEKPVWIAPTSGKKERVKFDLEKLQAVQRTEWVCDFAWLARRSVRDPREVSCGEFIDGLFDADERVMIFTSMRSTGDYMRWRGGWYALGKAPGQKAQRVKEGPRGSREGCVMLIQPVTGEWHPVQGTTRMSRRTAKSVMAWRHMLWESDDAPHEMWLNALAQVRMPIVAITTSGGRSLHALVRVEAGSHEEFGRVSRTARDVMTVMGWDPQSLSNPTAGMRLPNTMREGKNGKGGHFEAFPNGARKQRLIYWNPEARFDAHGVCECIGDRVPCVEEKFNNGGNEP